MHLKSTNGAIDVLVCPEDEAQSQCLQSPHNNSLSLRNEACDGRTYVLEQPCPQDTVLPDPVSLQQQHHHHHQHLTHQTPTKLENARQHDEAVGLSMDQTVCSPYPPQVTITRPNNDLDISLSSTADVNGDDLGFIDHFDSSLLPIDIGMFEHLSPPLQNEDFSFSMDNSTEGIHDLFDL